MKNRNEETTLADRLALGFGCAVITFITGLILWLIANWLFFSLNNHILFPFSIVWIFTSAGFVMGALTQENHLLRFFSPIWGAIYSFVKNIK